MANKRCKEKASTLPDLRPDSKWSVLARSRRKLSEIVHVAADAWKVELPGEWRWAEDAPATRTKWQVAHGIQTRAGASKSGIEAQSGEFRISARTSTNIMGKNDGPPLHLDAHPQ
jgi:hypothetical protein